MVYKCKLLKLNFRCVLLITLLDTVEVTPRPKAHFEVAHKLVVTVKQWFTTWKAAVYSKVAVYSKMGVYSKVAVYNL